MNKSLGLAALAIASAASAVAFNPPAQWSPGCISIQQKTVYCYGGERTGPLDYNNLYALDVSQPFDLSSNLPWTDRSNDTTFTTSSVAYFVIAPLTDGQSFIINGGSSNTLQKSLDYNTLVYNGVTHNWTIPNISGTPMVQRREHSVAVDGQGKVYFFGGASDMWTYGGPGTYYNTFVVLDTLSWTYSYPTPANPPFARIEHTSTYIDGKIYIVGGLIWSPNATGTYVLNPVSMSDVPTFDTSLSTWTNVTATGNIPVSRRGHTAVISVDGKNIIVFGGGDPTVGTNNRNDVYSLNSTSMVWTYQNVNGNPPQPRKEHQSVLVGSLMLVFFGSSNSREGLNDVNVLDTRTWTWLTTYGSMSGLGTGAIAGIVVGVLVLIVVVLFVLIKKPFRNRDWAISGPISLPVNSPPPLPPTTPLMTQDGASSQGVPPQDVPPQDVPPQGVPPQGVRKLLRRQLLRRQR